MKKKITSIPVKLEKKEKDVEVFAMHLLIPEDKLNEILKQRDPIPELAEEFQVSENFMRKRLKFKNGK